MLDTPQSIEHKVCSTFLARPLIVSEVWAGAVFKACLIPLDNLSRHPTNSQVCTRRSCCDCCFPRSARGTELALFGITTMAWRSRFSSEFVCLLKYAIICINIAEYDMIYTKCYTCWSPSKPPIKKRVWRVIWSGYTTSWVFFVFDSQFRSKCRQQSCKGLMLLAELLWYPVPGLLLFSSS